MNTPASTASAITDEQIVAIGREWGWHPNNAKGIGLVGFARAVLALAAPTAQPTGQAEADDIRYENLEREHLGDWEKKTGIYADMGIHIATPDDVNADGNHIGVLAGFARHKYRQGTKECVAFVRGARWWADRAAVEPSQPAPDIDAKEAITAAYIYAERADMRNEKFDIARIGFMNGTRFASRTPAPAAPEDAKQMTLGELELALRPLADDLVFPEAFGAPASYRGDYNELAFRPDTYKTVRDLKTHVEAGYGAFMGYKGGAYAMDAWTPVNIAAWGECGSEDDDQITTARFKRMLDAAIEASTKGATP